MRESPEGQWTGRSQAMKDKDKERVQGIDLGSSEHGACSTQCSLTKTEQII